MHKVCKLNNSKCKILEGIKLQGCYLYQNEATNEEMKKLNLFRKYNMCTAWYSIEKAHFEKQSVFKTFFNSNYLLTFLGY